MGRTGVPMNTSPTVAYAVVADNDDEQYLRSAATATAASPVLAVALDKPHHRVSEVFSYLPEASNLTWNDDFFDDDDDVVAVFDLDYENMEGFYSTLGWVAYGSTLFCGSIFWLGCLVGVPCFLRPNVSWTVRSQHVAVTRDGVRFVQDQHPTCWGQSCTDSGRKVKTITFDKITDCTVSEPTGNNCLCIENKLSTVKIATGLGDPHDLSLTGLLQPEAFKKLVLAMKRQTFAPASLESLDRGLSNVQDPNVTQLLRDIRDELRQHNQMLQGIQSSGVHPRPSAPPTTDIV